MHRTGRRSKKISVGAIALIATQFLTIGCDRSTAPPSAPAQLLAAGDIADCSSTADDSTAKLLDTLPGDIATLGDNVYPFASPANFTQCFDPSWGRHKARIHPAAGNHEYEGGLSDSYFNYFGAAAGAFGKGYYSYDLGSWHLIALNNEISMAADGEQVQWLKADLAASGRTCTLVYWHEPRFSSGPHGDLPGLQPLWQMLYDSKVDLVLNGHDHDYERFAPQTPAGAADPALGIREFVVGTGGESHYQFVSVQPNSEFRDDANFGILRLTLMPGKYQWQFITVSGAVLDSGEGACH